MAVYTDVTREQAAALVSRLGLGELLDLQGCSGGIENTNYFVWARQDDLVHAYVLTLFERLTHEQLPFYLQFTQHLAQAGVRAPMPHGHANAELVLELQGKPAAVLDCLPGSSIIAPTAEHCAEVAQELARLHLAGRSFEPRQPNPRGLAWCQTTAQTIAPFVSPSQRALIEQELAHQANLSARGHYAALPSGVIHADLFRDNVLFVHDSESPRLSGLLDFYFAGADCWAYDLAICLNDWCIDHETLTEKAPLAHVFISSYNRIRPLQEAELRLMPDLLRAAALRFWISRLWDYHLPRPASMLKPHDPVQFEDIVRLRASGATRLEPLAVCS